MARRDGPSSVTALGGSMRCELLPRSMEATAEEDNAEAYL